MVVVKRVVGYVRVSTEEQAVEGEGLSVQKEIIVKYAKDRGWSLLRIYEDAGISGSKSENRPALQQLLHDAKNKEFEAVIVSDLSRFGRDTRELHNNLYTIKESKIEFISIKEPITIRSSPEDLTNSSSEFATSIYAAVAQLERSTIRDRMLAGKMRKWRDNRCLVGQPPYGYVWKKETKRLANDQGIEVNEEEKAIYEEIVDLYLNYGLSMKDIALKLRDEGIKSKRAPFSSATISFILKNPAYYGCWDVNKSVYDGKKRTGEMKPSDKHISFTIKGFISKSTWDKIQERTAFNKHKAKRVTLTRGNWLRDVVYCGQCERESRVKPHYGNKRTDGSQLCYYRCYWAGTSAKDLAASRKKKCSLPYIPAQKLENRVWQRIVFHLTVSRDKYFEEFVADKSNEKLVEEKTKQCEKITKKIAKENRAKERLYELLKEESFNRDEFLSKLDIAKEKITQLEHDYKACEDEMAEVKELLTKIKKVESFPRMDRGKIARDLWKLGVDDRKRLAENMFGKISVYYSDKEDDEGFKVKYHKYGTVTILDQLIREGKLPSFNLNSSYHTSRPDLS